MFDPRKLEDPAINTSQLFNKNVSGAVYWTESFKTGEYEETTARSFTSNSKAYELRSAYKTRTITTEDTTNQETSNLAYISSFKINVNQNRILSTSSAAKSNYNPTSSFVNIRDLPLSSKKHSQSSSQLNFNQGYKP